MTPEMRVLLVPVATQPSRVPPLPSAERAEMMTLYRNQLETHAYRRGMITSAPKSFLTYPKPTCDQSPMSRFSNH